MKRFIAQSMNDLPDMALMLSMSGLEFMQGVVNGTIAGPPIGHTLGFWPTLAEDGRVVFTGTPDFNATNPMRTVHGGWYGAILDSCMACAVMTKLPRGQAYTTLEYKINILRAIPIDTEIQAIGTVQHAGRSTGVANGEIRGTKDDRLYATGSTTCIFMTPQT